METPETTSAFRKYISWFKQNILFIILFVLLSIFVVYKLNKLESIIVESIVLPNVSLDFQNKSGSSRIKSSFTDVLVGSSGAIKKGNGYELKLRVLNPSSVTLKNIRCEFRDGSSNKPAIYEDIRMSISPGTSKTLKCFISDLSDNDLKSIDVSVKFNEVYYYQR